MVGPGQLVGRGDELDEVGARLGAHRLVTVVGPGGVGKTTIARASATRVRDRFGDRVYLVDLTRVESADAVSATVSAQLGFESIDALRSSPADDDGLVVIDNCEHVLDAVAEVVIGILHDRPDLVVLATSRSPLDVPGESLVTVSPLAVPSATEPDPESAPAVQLFLERARDAGVTLSADDVRVVASVCRRLDGLPLALEIAAARCRTMSVGEISEMLADGLGVLDRPRYRGARRHRSVTATIRWSHDLLEARERAVLRRVAVLPGSFTSAAAAEVAGLDDPGAVVAGLDELVHASLVSADPTGPVATFRLLDSVRRFALERLDEAGETEDTYHRFADHALASSLARLRGTGAAWRPTIVAELLEVHADVAEALRWCLAHDTDSKRSRRLCAAMWGVVHQGRAEEVLDLARRTAARWPERDRPGYAEATATLATAEYVTGDPAAAVALAEDALLTVTGPTVAAVTLRRVIGQGRRALDDLDGSISAFREGAEVGRQLGMPAMALELVTAHAVVEADAGRVGDAIDRVGDVIDEAIAIGSELTEVWGRSALAWLALRQGDDPREQIVDALARCRAIDYPIGVSVNLRSLAVARLAAGDHVGAVDAVDELCRSIIARGALSDARLLLDAVAVVAHRLGHPAWDEAAATARSLPIVSLLASKGHDLVPLPEVGAAAVPRRDCVAFARRVLAELHDLAAASDGPVEAPPPGAAPSAAEMVDGGDVWTISYRDRTVTVRASKGMTDLARLVAEPGREVHCLDLMDAVAEEASVGDAIDAEARRRYEERIRELQADIDEAERGNDFGRLERAQDELDAIVEHLAGALGVGGRARRTGGSTERARSAVTHRLRSAIRHLDDLHPLLAAHLRASVSTGTYCSYRPPEPVDWRVR